MRVLCVAEKPSIAKSVANILSGGTARSEPSPDRYVRNYEFDYPQTNDHYVVTAVKGHLMASDFYDTHKNWQSCDPFALFDADINVFVPNDNKAMERNILTLSRNADMLMIWTDCDREGEHIGSEISRIARRGKRNIVIKRARFSAIIPQQIHHAAQNPVNLDQAQADAVEARIFLDLRIGAAFTRMQTMTLQAEVAQIEFDAGPVSYGPCQFPTLGFVVARWKDVKDFRPEPFWYIYLSIAHDGAETKFTWKRGHLFDHNEAANLYERVMSNVTAHVTNTENKETKKWKPLPLTTVELQKAGSRLLRMSPKKVLDIAEKLYQQGFLSYPRTETDQYDPQFDFHHLIEKQVADPAWGQFARGLGPGQPGFSPPRRGKNNDKAHPPIHPTAHAPNITGDEKRVYEYITRRFLASCSRDAEGFMTTVSIDCGEEAFSANGLLVLERNYLDVYPYDKWEGHSIPNFQVGEQFQPSVCELRNGETSSPSLLTEADLVTLMDKNGIGTDATIASHIETIVKRDYVIEEMIGNTKYLKPSTLGVGLVDGYDRIGLNKSLSKPQLRRETERRMLRVCQGATTKADMMEQSLTEYKEMYTIARAQFRRITESVRNYMGGAQTRAQGGGAGRGRGNGNGGGRGGRDGGGGGHGGGRDGGDGDGHPPPPPAGRSSRGRGARGGAPKRGRGAGLAPASVVHIDSDEDIEIEPPPRPVSHAGPPPSHTAPPRQPPESGTSEAPLCYCNIPADRKTVASNSSSKGRLYWSCGNNGACKLFRYCDPPNISPTPAVPAKRPYSSTAGSSDSTSKRRCQCDLTAISLTVKKANENQGRKFWKCPNSEGACCKYFEWDDEPAAAMPAGAPGSSRSQAAPDAPPRSTGGGDNACYKCGQGGHWANACPNNNTNAPGAGQSHGQAAVGNECYKCHQSGHWANSCPNEGDGPPTKRRSLGARTDNAPRSSGVKCFKCQQEGHFAPDCPNSNGGGGRGRKAPSSRGRGGKSRGGGAGRKASKYGAPE